jgi:NADH dehydrogenase [ubiquinone] 1 alpha subcomplex assembly factor 2
VDVARQQRVLVNVALIEARDQQERAQMLRLNAATTPATPGTNDNMSEITSPPDEPLQAQPSSHSPSPDARPSDRRQIPTSPEPYAPQSWAPRARKRGGES